MRIISDAVARIKMKVKLLNNALCASLTLICLAPASLGAMSVPASKRPLAAAQESSLAPAVVAYNEKQYSLALSELKQDLDKNPHDVTAHYYAGLCYQSLAQISAAKAEYNFVYAHSKDYNLRYNACKALIDMNTWAAHRCYKGNGNKFSYQPRSSKRGRR